MHGGEAVQAMFGFRFEVHREGITAALLSGEDLVAIQLAAQPAYGQNDLTSRTVRMRRTDWFNSQPFHRTQPAGRELAGGKSMPVQHSYE